MRVIIAGSRTITDYATVCEAVTRSGFKVAKVVSGAAKGVDTLAIEYAQRNGIPCDVFHADWRRHGRSAGYRRNTTMARNADALVAIWDGKSPGTRHMIETATRHGLRVYVHRANALRPTLSQTAGARHDQ